MRKVYTFEVPQGKAQYVKKTSSKEFTKNCKFVTVQHPQKIMVWSVISPKGMESLHIIVEMNAI